MMRKWRLRRRDEHGFSLTEVMVSMAVMGTFMAMVTNAIIQVFDSVNRSETISSAQSAVNLAFLRLDKEIRYAANISTVGPAGVGNTDTAVDYLTLATGQSTNQYPSQCTELRVHNDVFEVARWSKDSTPTSSTVAWNLLATGVTGANPFAFYPADNSFGFPRLSLNLQVTFGNGRTATTRLFAVTFYALNSLPDSADTTVCTGIRGL